MPVLDPRAAVSSEHGPASSRRARPGSREVGPLPIDVDAIETIFRHDENRFSGFIYTFEIGRGRKSFTAPEVILSQSPVLKQWCAANESTLHFYLRNLSSTVFSLVLEYLYTHDLDAIVLRYGAESARVLGRMYIAGTQLRLNLLSDAIITHLNNLALSRRHAALLFEIAEEVYHSTPTLDTAFRDWFKTTMVSLHNEKDLFPESTVKRLVAKGGRLAVDILFAQRRGTEQARHAAERETSLAAEREAIARQEADREADPEKAMRERVDRASRREDERRARAYARIYESQQPHLSSTAFKGSS